MNKSHRNNDISRKLTAANELTWAQWPASCLTHGLPTSLQSPINGRQHPLIVCCLAMDTMVLNGWMVRGEQNLYLPLMFMVVCMQIHGIGTAPCIAGSVCWTLASRLCSTYWTCNTRCHSCQYTLMSKMVWLLVHAIVQDGVRASKC